ncbi:hypothetical protein [Dysgonomonas sp. 520]|uniref:hypothetical protein n=1 Tax=Dysgonomonas sp. 520 TaxID=2302931 RepID=UPI0013CFF6FC|nr:hypothetical protein [Dysgonomonas sp. 520]
MSQIKEIVEIKVPDNGYSFSQKEILTTKSYPCPVCHGMGGKRYNEHDPEYYTVGKFVLCPKCLGSCRVRAKVTVEWEADMPKVEANVSLQKRKELMEMLEDLNSRKNTISYDGLIESVDSEIKRILEQ